MSRNRWFSVQVPGKGWKELSRHFLWDEAVAAAKKWSRHKWTDGPRPSRIRFGQRTLSYYEGGKVRHPFQRLLYIWPDGSREWQPEMKPEWMANQ